MEGDRTGRDGVIFAASAFIIWGFMPLYFKLLQTVPAPEIVACRVLFAVPVLAVLIGVKDRFRSLRVLIGAPRNAKYLALSAALISCNWLTFIWAVTHERVLETSLGYFINPLVSVLLGVIFLSERLRPAAVFAVGLAAAGVGYLVVVYGSLPWVALVLAFSFGLYGLIRKNTAVDSLTGLSVEITLIAPVAIGYVVYAHQTGSVSFGHGPWTINLWLVIAGPLTILPLSLFAAGARRINLSTVGFLQYIAPTLTFLSAVFLFGEPFGQAQLITFTCIWTALFIFTVDAFRATRVAVVTEQ